MTQNMYIIYSKTDRSYVITEAEFTEDIVFATRFTTIGEAIKVASSIMKKNNVKDYQVYPVFE